MIRHSDPVGKKQAEELQTVKARHLVLSLSDKDLERLEAFSETAGITPCKLIESFVGDLTGGTLTHGSDERRQAVTWYENVYLTPLTVEMVKKENQLSETLARITNRRESE